MEFVTEDREGNSRMINVERITKDLYGGSSLTYADIMKEDKDIQPTRQRRGIGSIPWPFKVDQLPKFQVLNQYHSTCLHAKKNSTIGLGFVSEAEMSQGVSAINSYSPDLSQAGREMVDEFRDAALNPFYFESEIDEEMNPYCYNSWSDVMSAMGEDYYQSGNGFIEVVRQRKSKTTTSGDGVSSRTNAGDITGVYHIMTNTITAHMTKDKFLFWKVNDSVCGGDQYWAPFGKWQEFYNNSSLSAKMKGSDVNYSEVIHFRKPTAMHNIYGFPDWFSAIHPMELISAMGQFKYNFFNNRGVPEFMMFIKGQIGDDQWTQIKNSVQTHIGQSNSHKTFAVNFDNEEVDIQVERLNMDSKTDTGMFKDKESLQADIVTAHRMPPLLGNILIPGKLGSTNEFPNALMSFQTLTVSQEQRVIEQTLRKTIGDADLNGQLNVTPNMLVLRKLTDLINIGQADTVSRMRETTEEAAANGRDISEGLED